MTWDEGNSFVNCKLYRENKSQKTKGANLKKVKKENLGGGLFAENIDDTAIQSFEKDLKQ